MASSIDASTSGAGGVITTADNTGILQLKTAGTTAVTVDASQNVGIGTTSPNGKFESYANSGYSVIANSSAGSVAINPSSNAILFGTTNVAAYATGNYDAATHVYKTSGTERMRIDSSGNLLFNSGYGSVATAYGCRAWVNFNGTGTVAIRASGNVTSITDNGTGEYTINFTTTMPDANYATVLGGNWSGTAAITSIAASSPTYSTSAVKVQIVDRNGSSQDISIVSAAIIR